MFLIVDNYDSFTWNIYHALGELETNVDVIRNDKILPDKILSNSYKGIIISPGPGHPENSGYSVNIIQELAGRIPILGICLGHQAIAYSFGAKIVKAKKVMHGRTDQIKIIKRSKLFNSIPKSFIATRYHSLIIYKKSLPSNLQIIAENDDKIIMAIKHRKYPIYGIQFHPESIASENGNILFKNFRDICI